MGGGGTEIAGAVDAGFEGAAGGGGSEDGDGVEVEGHGGAVTCVYCIHDFRNLGAVCKDRKINCWRAGVLFGLFALEVGRQFVQSTYAADSQ